MDEDWQADLERWLEPYLGSLANKTRRRMCPAYCRSDRAWRSQEHPAYGSPL